MLRDIGEYQRIFEMVDEEVFAEYVYDPAYDHTNPRIVSQYEDELQLLIHNGTMRINGIGAHNARRVLHYADPTNTDARYAGIRRQIVAAERHVIEERINNPESVPDGQDYFTRIQPFFMQGTRFVRMPAVLSRDGARANRRFVPMREDRLRSLRVIHGDPTPADFDNLQVDRYLEYLQAQQAFIQNDDGTVNERVLEEQRQYVWTGSIAYTRRDDRKYYDLTKGLRTPYVYTNGTTILIVPSNVNSAVGVIQQLVLDTRPTSQVPAASIFPGLKYVKRSLVPSDLNVSCIGAMKVAMRYDLGEPERNEPPPVDTGVEPIMRYKVNDITQNEFNMLQKVFDISVQNEAFGDLSEGNFRRLEEFFIAAERSQRPLSNIRIARYKNVSVDIPLRIVGRYLEMTSTPARNDKLLNDFAFALSSFTVFVSAMMVTIESRRSFEDEIGLGTPFYMFSVFIANYEREMNEVGAISSNKVTLQVISSAFFNLLPIILDVYRAGTVRLLKVSQGGSSSRSDAQGAADVREIPKPLFDDRATSQIVSHIEKKSYASFFLSNLAKHPAVMVSLAATNVDISRKAKNILPTLKYLEKRSVYPVLAGDRNRVFDAMMDSDSAFMFLDVVLKDPDNIKAGFEILDSALHVNNIEEGFPDYHVVFSFMLVGDASRRMTLVNPLLKFIKSLMLRLAPRDEGEAPAIRMHVLGRSAYSIDAGGSLISNTDIHNFMDAADQAAGYDVQQNIAIAGEEALPISNISPGDFPAISGDGTAILQQLLGDLAAAPQTPAAQRVVQVRTATPRRSPDPQIARDLMALFGDQNQ